MAEKDMDMDLLSPKIANYIRALKAEKEALKKASLILENEKQQLEQTVAYAMQEKYENTAPLYR